MQTADEPLETKELTTAFGWSNENSWQQQDIEEFFRLLSDTLEEKMKGTDAEGTFRIFEGKVRAYIKCLTVAYESAREEVFSDIHLVVRDQKDIYDSFDTEITPDRLEGENRYDAEGHGLQVADKGISFISYPPVLFLHLKRFEYNPATDMMSKVNDRYQFYDEITLKPSPDLTRTADGGDPPRHAYDPEDTANAYVLFGVLVHSGSAHGGHYYAYVKAQSGGNVQWLKYDDERVSQVSAQQAIQENYGGKDPQKFWESNRDSIRSAYMLIYIKKDEWSKFVFTMSDEDIPRHVSSQLQTESVERQRMKKERDEEHLFFRFHIVSDDDFKVYHQQELQKDLYIFNNHPVTKVRKDSDWESFKKLVSTVVPGQPDSQRLWGWCIRTNKTYRPNTVHLKTKTSETILPTTILSDIFGSGSKRHSYDRLSADVKIPLYVEQKGRLQLEFPSWSSDSALLFFKHYDPAAPPNSSLRYVGQLLINRSAILSSVLPLLNSSIGRSSSSELLLFEEICVTMVQGLDTEKTVRELELDHGDILIFQIPKAEVPPESSFVTVTDLFAGLLVPRVTVRFHPLADPSTESCRLQLLTNMDYATVCQHLVECLPEPTPAENIRLTACSMDQPFSNPFTVEQRKDLQTMLGVSRSHLDADRVIYWESLSIPLREMEAKVLISVMVFDKRVQRVGQPHELILDRSCTVRDIIATLKKKEPSIVADSPLQLIRIIAHKFDKIIPYETPVSDLTLLGGEQFRCEEVPALPDGLSASEISTPKNQVSYSYKIWQVADNGARLLQVVHVTPDQLGSIHSNPFFFWICPTETVSQIRERMRLKLNKLEDDFKRWPLGLWFPGGAAPKTLEDDDVVLDLVKQKELQPPYTFEKEVKLCLIHRDPAKKSMFAGAEMKING